MAATDVILRACDYYEETSPCLEVEEAAYGEHSWAKSAYQSRILRGLLREFKNVVLADVRQDGDSRLGGFAVIQCTYVGATLYGCIERLCVHPAGQRRKIGTHLLKAVEQRAARTGVLTLGMRVHESSLPAQLFLKSQGWLASATIGEAICFDKHLSQPETDSETDPRRFRIVSSIPSV